MKEKKRYTREDFKEGKCPNCGGTNIKEIEYMYPPFMKNDYKCRACKAENNESLLDCFIATAVYGDRNAPQVQTLRDFRDNVLIKSSIGKTITNFYYSGAGKRTADFIKRHLPSTIPIVRKGLDVLVERYSAKQREKNDN